MLKDLDMARAGDDTAFAAIERDFAGLLRYVVRDYFGPGLTEDDLMQEARVGLWKAIHDFDAGAGMRFDGFVKLCVMRQVITAVKTVTRDKHQILNRAVSLSLPADSADPDAGVLADIIPNDEPDADEMIALRHAVDQIYEGLESLSDLERIAVEVTLLDRDGYELAAALADCDVKAIDNAAQRGRRKLRQFAGSAVMACP